MTDDPFSAISTSPLHSDINAEMRVDFAVDEVGKILIFHDRPFKESIGWIEYSRAEQKIYFVTDDGNMRGLGVRVPDLIGDRVIQSDHATLIYVESGVPKETMDVSFVMNCLT